ncbi:hypothetical protein Tco_0366017 [Tanacetum coccineum]
MLLDVKENDSIELKSEEGWARLKKEDVDKRLSEMIDISFALTVDVHVILSRQRWTIGNSKQRCLGVLGYEDDPLIYREILGIGLCFMKGSSSFMDCSSGEGLQGESSFEDDLVDDSRLIFHFTLLV